MSDLKKGDYVRTNKALYATGGGPFNGEYIHRGAEGYLIGQRQLSPVSVWVVAFAITPKTMLVMEDDIDLDTDSSVGNTCRGVKGGQDE